jgi:hypothetical protein
MPAIQSNSAETLSKIKRDEMLQIIHNRVARAISDYKLNAKVKIDTASEKTLITIIFKDYDFDIGFSVNNEDVTIKNSFEIPFIRMLKDVINDKLGVNNIPAGEDAEIERLEEKMDNAVTMLEGVKKILER